MQLGEDKSKTFSFTTWVAVCEGLDFHMIKEKDGVCTSAAERLQEANTMNECC